MKYFYKQAKLIDMLSEQPTSESLKRLLDIIKKDEALEIYFYGGYDEKVYPSAEWVSLLFKAGEFDDLSVEEGKDTFVHRLKAMFLKKAATNRPDDVFAVISSIIPKEMIIQTQFLEAIEVMPLDYIEKSVGYILDFLKDKKRYIWHLQGRVIAQIMLKLIGKPEQAFIIAGLLVEMWVPDVEKSSRLRDPMMRFGEDDYAEFMREYYSKVWEIHPFQAFELLVQVMDDYLNQYKAKYGNDQSETYHITVEDIAQGHKWGLNSVSSVYIDSLYKIMVRLCDADAEIIDKILSLLNSKNKAIFTRFEILFLGMIKGDAYKERINEIAQNEEYFKKACYNNEYNRLINNKKHLLSENAKKKILGWISLEKISDKERFDEWFKQRYDRDPNDEDYKQYENRYRAQWLYAIREVFPEEYKEYKERSKATDDDLKPLSFHSEVRSISGDEGTPLTTKEMLEKGVDYTLAYLLDENNYEYTPKIYQPNTPQEALGYSFQNAVRAAPVDYLNAKNDDIQKLPARFLSRYFLGLWEALRGGRIEGFSWEKFISIAEVIVEKHYRNEEGYFLRYLIDCIKEGFGKPNSITFTEDQIDKIFDIANKLLNYKDESSSTERDPVQKRCNSVSGEALMVCLNLGAVCKKDIKSYYEASFKCRLEKAFEMVLNQIKTPWAMCTFGSEFSRIFWLMPDWVEKHIDVILSDENWKIVWETYLHWGRPSRELFEFLSKNGIYLKAIERRDVIDPVKGHEKTENELVQHFIIAYFNGWVDSYEDKLFSEFIHSASDELLGFAAQFFTTGFKDLKEEPNPEVNQRLLTYWTKRLEAIKPEPEKHIKEAMALAGWIKDCPLDKSQTLDLVEQTVQLCKGYKFEHNFYYNVVASLCGYADIDKLKVIRCLKIILCGQDIPMTFSFYKESLTALLTGIRDDMSASRELILETMELMDNLGRFRIYQYKDIFWVLNERLEKAG